MLDVTLIAGPREVAINGRWVTTNVYTTCYSHRAVAADGTGGRLPDGIGRELWRGRCWRWRRATG
ncbi:MAG: hypothetical protein R3D59_01600 [Paracoccaceae bacterium]